MEMNQFFSVVNVIFVVMLSCIIFHQLMNILGIILLNVCHISTKCNLNFERHANCGTRFLHHLELAREF